MKRVYLPKAGLWRLEYLSYGAAYSASHRVLYRWTVSVDGRTVYNHVAVENMLHGPTVFFEGQHNSELVIDPDPGRVFLTLHED